jgi:hypothetical protein
MFVQISTIEMEKNHHSGALFFENRFNVAIRNAYPYNVVKVINHLAEFGGCISGHY